MQQIKMASKAKEGASVTTKHVQVKTTANNDTNDDDPSRGNYDGKNKRSSAVAITKLLSKRPSSAANAISKTPLSASHEGDSNEEEDDVEDGFIAL